MPDVDDRRDDALGRDMENELLESFACKAQTAMGDKRAGAQVPAFLDYVHTALVEDTLERPKRNIHQGRLPLLRGQSPWV